MWRAPHQDSLCDRLVLDLHFVLPWQSHLLCVYFLFSKKLQREPTSVERKMELLNRQQHLGICCFIWQLITTSGILAGGVYRSCYYAKIYRNWIPVFYLLISIDQRHIFKALYIPHFVIFFSQSRQRSGRTIARSSVLMWWIESKSLALFISNLVIQLVFSSVGPRYI